MRAPETALMSRAPWLVALLTLLSFTTACSSEDGCTSDDDCVLASQRCEVRSGQCVGGGGADASTVSDAAVSDASARLDASSVHDGGADAGVMIDAGRPDAGPPDGGTAPVRLQFPPGGGLTSADRIRVRGATTPGAPVSAISVNGVTATSSDGFSTFSAQIPLSLGANPVRVDVTGDTGVSRFRLADIERQDILLLAPRDMDLVGDTLFIVDSGFARVVSVDRTTGARRLVSGAGAGSGPDFVDPRGISVRADGQLAFVTDIEADAIFEVDLATGARRVISGAMTGTGPALDTARRLTLDAARARLLVVDNGLDALLAVALATGDRTVVSDDVTGSGPPMGSPRDLVLDAARDRVLVADSSAAALFAISLTTGDRTVISGQGAFFSAPRGVALSADGSSAYVTDSEIATLFLVDLTTGDRTVVSDPTRGQGIWADPRRVLVDGTDVFVLDYIADAIVRVDPASGDRTAVAASPAGTGLHFGGPWGIAVDPQDPKAQVFVSDNFFERIYAVTTQTGDRRVLSGASSDGPNLDQPYGIAVRPGTRTALVVDAILDAVVSVDLNTGERAYLSNEVIAMGPPFDAPRDVDVDANGAIYVIDSGADAVFSVEGSNGDRSVVSSDDTGTGPVFDAPWALAVDATRPDTLWVVDSGVDGLFRVDLANGDRALLPGSGPALVTPRGLAMSADGAAAYVSDLGSKAVLQVDLTTGVRTAIASATVGRGPALSVPSAIALHADGYLLLVDDNDAIIAIDLGSGDRVYMSK